MSVVAAPEATAVPTDQLLTWATSLQFDDLPREAVEVLRDNLIDGLACGLFGSTLPSIRAIRSTLLRQAGGDASRSIMWGTQRRAAPLDTVIVNGAAINGFELDGGNHLVRNVHGAMTVYPVILAVAELTHAVSGQDLLAAAAAGQETSVRMSKALGPTVMDRGWYGTPIFATLGSAVAAGRALHLNPEQMKGCFELALLHASGLTVTSEEGVGKPLSSGEAVRSGLLCALLAADGCRGPRHAYDHKKGFAAAFSTPSERNDAALQLREGDPLASAHSSFKAYASCGAAHPVADMLLDFIDANPSIGPDSVADIEVRLNVTSARHVGREYVPSDTTNAQFNLAYCVAALLLEGDLSVDQFRPELLRDPRILDLTRRVKSIPDESVGSHSTNVRNEAYVTVRLKDGTTLQDHRETSRDPDRAALRKKFLTLAAYAVSSEAASQLVTAVDNIENLKDAAVLAELLVGTDAAADPDDVPEIAELREVED